MDLVWDCLVPNQERKKGGDLEWKLYKFECKIDYPFCDDIILWISFYKPC
jgi:hypothetical protein